MAAAAATAEEAIQAWEVSGSAIPVPRATRSIGIYCCAAPLRLVMPPLRQDLLLPIHSLEPSLRELAAKLVLLPLRSVQRGINVGRGNGWGMRGERLGGSIKRNGIVEVFWRANDI